MGPACAAPGQPGAWARLLPCQAWCQLCTAQAAGTHPFFPCTPSAVFPGAPPTHDARPPHLFQNQSSPPYRIFSPQPCAAAYTCGHLPSPPCDFCALPSRALCRRLFLASVAASHELFSKCTRLRFPCIPTSSLIGTLQIALLCGCNSMRKTGRGAAGWRLSGTAGRLGRQSCRRWS